MKPLLIVTAAGSLAIGFGVGYKVAEKRLAAQFDARLDKETAGMREFYQTAKKPFATPQEAAAALIQGADVEEEPQERTAEVVSNKVAYHKIVKTHYEPDPDPEEVVVESEVGPPPVQHNLFQETAHIISQDEFMQHDSEYIQATLTYYKADNVLVDERDCVIEELDDTVGASNMLMFGTDQAKSSDPNILHIRNGRLQMEFEVALSQDSFSREVLGIDPNPVEMPSGRKRS